MPVQFYIMLAIIVPLLVLVVILSSKEKNLNSIKAKTVGDGQHGKARFATQKEITQAYPLTAFTPDLWRQGKNLPDSKDAGIVIGFERKKGTPMCRLDCSDSHTLAISTTGGGKTTFFLYPNIEYTLACGCSFVCTDSKGDVFRDYAGIARDCYGFTPYVFDLRFPLCSDKYNLIHLVNKYIALYQESGKPEYLARAEKYAKITARSIVHTKGFDGGGQNAFFYDSAEGLIASVILLVSEFCPKEERHIVSVFKIILELLEKDSDSENKETYFHKLMRQLPPEHKAKWLAGAALAAPDESMASVISTAISRLLSFIDSEIEQLMCFDNGLDTEKLCTEKSAVFIVFPEADKSKQFLVPLIIKQLYDECIEFANHHGNRLDRRMYFFLDEYGTMPAFPDAEAMFSAGRSRNILQVPIIQSLSQLEENYGRYGAETIKECCQNIIFGGLSPLSPAAEELSKSLGNQTVLSGSVSTGSSSGSGRKGSNQSLQMIARPLMTPDEIRTLPMGEWIFLKTRNHPMHTTLKRYSDWNIILNQPFHIPSQPLKPIRYASRETLIGSVHHRFMTHNPEPFILETDYEPPAQKKQFNSYS